MFHDTDPFDRLLANDSSHDEIAPFGKHWCGPKHFAIWSETLVARYKGQGDGQDVEVYCTAAPARFYRVKALPTPNSVGEINRGFSMSTGSGEAQTAALLAEKISEGMLGLTEEGQ